MNPTASSESSSSKASSPSLRSATLLRLAALGIVLLGLYALVTGWQSYANPQVVVDWSTATELDTAGFNLYRAESPDGPFVQANDTLLPSSPDPLTGGEYTFTDTSVAPGITYFYQLEEVEYNGATQRFDPIQVDAEGSLLSILLATIIVLAGGVLFFTTLIETHHRLIKEHPMTHQPINTSTNQPIPPSPPSSSPLPDSAIALHISHPGLRPGRGPALSLLHGRSPPSLWC